MKNQEQLYRLLEELIDLKRSQRAIEERLFQILSKPVHRKWLYERVQDQYKHEKIICELARTYLDKNIDIKMKQAKEDLHTSIVQELHVRLENVTKNIQLINKISQPIEEFKMYKLINGLLCDEYIYQSRLMRILTEK